MRRTDHSWGATEVAQANWVLRKMVLDNVDILDHFRQRDCHAGSLESNLTTPTHKSRVLGLRAVYPQVRLAQR